MCLAVRAQNQDANSPSYAGLFDVSSLQCSPDRSFTYGVPLVLRRECLSDVGCDEAHIPSRILGPAPEDRWHRYRRQGRQSPCEACFW